MLFAKKSTIDNRRCAPCEKETHVEQFLTYFPSAFSWGNLAVLILGSAGGLFFGAMPGLSPTMAVALLVPFTFYLPADTSLILLGAVYTSAVAGGSISAILLSIPGAPSSIATLFDGYPMAKQGRAQEALYTVFVSSLIGGVFGVLVMILFSPPMAEFAMRFGPSELFWTAIFGITVITGLSSGAMLKGLFGGALGMLLSTVGYSTLTGEPRFVIHEALNGGIALVPALIGLFAVPQIIDLMADSHVLLEKLTFKPQKGMLRQVIKAHRRYLRTLGIGSLIVIYIGVGLLRAKASLEGGKDVNIPIWKLFTTAFVVTWMNPQALIDGTMMLGAFRATLPAGGDLPFIFGFGSASILWFLTLSTVVSLLGSKFNEKILNIINKVCGAVIIFYGCKLLWSFVKLMGWL